MSVIDECSHELDGVILCAGGLVLRHGHTFEGRELQEALAVPWAAVRAIGHCDDDCLWLDIDARPEDAADGYLPITRYWLQSPEEAADVADVTAELTAAWELGLFRSLGGPSGAWYRPMVQTPERDRLASEDGMITDGYGSYWSVTCSECGEDAMEVVRPGKVQCGECE